MVYGAFHHGAPPAGGSRPGLTPVHEGDVRHGEGMPCGFYGDSVWLIVRFLGVKATETKRFLLGYFWNRHQKTSAQNLRSGSFSRPFFQSRWCIVARVMVCRPAIVDLVDDDNQPSCAGAARAPELQPRGPSPGGGAGHTTAGSGDVGTRVAGRLLSVA